MAKYKKINEIRRQLMRSITRGIGRSHAANERLTDPLLIRRILICRPNDRLGNLLLITPLLQELAQTFPEAKVDLFVRGGAAPFVFSGYPSVDRILMLPKRPFSHLGSYFGKWWALRSKKYDLAINVDNNSSSGRLSTSLANAKFKSFGDAPLDPATSLDFGHIAKNPIYHLRHYLQTVGLPSNNNAVAPLDIKLSAAELDHGAKLLQAITHNSRKTIGVFTFATGSKCYSKEWWASCYSSIQKNYPDCNIVEILPMHNESQIDFAAPSFYSKDVREMASLMAHLDVFIGADSGIMHLSSASGAPTVGLFWVTNINKYAPYGNGSFGVNTNETPLEQWIPMLAPLLDSSPK